MCSVNRPISLNNWVKNILQSYLFCNNNIKCISVYCFNVVPLVYNFLVITNEVVVCHQRRNWGLLLEGGLVYCKLNMGHIITCEQFVRTKSTNFKLFWVNFIPKFPYVNFHVHNFLLDNSKWRLKKSTLENSE